MPQTAVYDYFYGNESEQFSFYRIPRLLVTGEQFRTLSIDAKLLYGLMLDRMSMSAKNGWFDEKGRVYIFYTLEEIKEAMNCGHDRALRMLVELDVPHGIGLIKRRKRFPRRRKSPRLSPPKHRKRRKSRLRLQPLPTRRRSRKTRERPGLLGWALLSRRSSRIDWTTRTKKR